MTLHIVASKQYVIFFLQAQSNCLKEEKLPWIPLGVCPISEGQKCAFAILIMKEGEGDGEGQVERERERERENYFLLGPKMDLEFWREQVALGWRFGFLPHWL